MAIWAGDLDVNANGKPAIAPPAVCWEIEGLRLEPKERSASWASDPGDFGHGVWSPGGRYKESEKGMQVERDPSDLPRS